MNAVDKKKSTVPGSDIVHWLAPLGLSVRIFFQSFSFESLANLDKKEFGIYCKWMGQNSFHLVVLAAVFVSTALTIECVVETQKFRAQDLSGAVIAIGLLRELGPLTVSLAWCSRVSALVAEEARNVGTCADLDFARYFVFPRYLAALLMSIPLGAYGLFFGFITAALVAKTLGVTSANDFLESAKLGITDKDVFVYFLKLILINPTIGVFAGAAAGRAACNRKDIPVAANAVTATFLTGYVMNTLVTCIAFLP